MTFQDTILESLERVQREILMRGSELSRDELWKVFNGEPEPSVTLEVKPKKKRVAKKKKEVEKEPEVESWRNGRYGKLYLKCVNTGRLYDPSTEEEVGIYTFNPDKELETVTLYES